MKSLRGLFSFFYDLPQLLNLLSNSNTLWKTDRFCYLFQSLRVPSSQHFQLYDFKFDDMHMDDDDTLKVNQFL